MNLSFFIYYFKIILKLFCSVMFKFLMYNLLCGFNFLKSLLVLLIVILVIFFFMLNIVIFFI